MRYFSSWQVITVTFLSLCFSALVNAGAHNHPKKMQKRELAPTTCEAYSVACAKTVTTAFAPNGDVWRVWVAQQQMYYQVSKDLGKQFSKVKSFTIAAENVAARNENRPKIAFDNNNGVYLSWALSGKKRFTGDIRFSYSTDSGETFSLPVTINDDGFITGHSFNEMHVTASGDVSIVWLDSRYRYLQKKAGFEFNGSELYLAKGNPRKGINFTNQALARGTCVCCRIAIDVDNNDNLAVFWRHIFGDNIREFALLTLDEKRPELAQTQQISFDHWYIEGCPHQGGGISITDANRYHLVWYNQGDNGKGIFYAFSDDAGKTTAKPFSVGNITKQAAHPHISHTKNVVDIVWTEFTGETHQLWHQQSINNGLSFKQAVIIAESVTGSDRPFIITHDGNTLVSWLRSNTDHWLSLL